ncbi:hypothetical protein BIW11_07844 [Tropilaelaps mercedesae]|uniref:Uncharacterized protein n=1 Tax=Tropilaelaps mercedesae TaxID=418985 RepID=A0A1V9XS41_9ACAR|nr:hypothetical protein BIW11_07844 [Tropilaelaps mercedesae]
MVCIPCIIAPLIPIILILWKFVQPFLQKLGFTGNIELTANCPIDNLEPLKERSSGDSPKDAHKEQETVTEKKKD